MKILYLHQHFVINEGSGGVRSFEFSKYLVQKGHEVTLITGKFESSGLPEDAPKRLKISGINVIRLNVRYGQKMNFFRRIISFTKFSILASIECIKVKHVDIIFATSTPLTIIIPALVAKIWHRKKLIFEVRDLWPDVPIELGILKNPVTKFFARILEKIAYRTSDHIIALSTGMKYYIVKHGITESKVSVITNASDTHIFRQYNEKTFSLSEQYPELKNKNWIVYAGTIGKVNDVEWLVKLGGKLKNIDKENKNVILIIGEGSNKNNCIKLAENLKVLNDKVFFFDKFKRKELINVLSESKLLTSLFLDLKYMNTNSANKFFDAFAAGKPIAINYGGWQADLIKETGAGLVLDRNDLEKSAKMIYDFLNDEKQITYAEKQSKYLGDEVFNRQKLAEDFERVLLKFGKTASYN